MEIGAIAELVEHVVAVRADDIDDQESLQSGLTSITRVRSWLDSSEADLARRLATKVSFPEAAIAETSRSTLTSATKTIDRSNTLNKVPALSAALDDGAITSGHIDAITRTAAGLEPEQHVI